MDRNALVVGATGLVGRHLLAQLLDDPDYASVVALTRRPLQVPHPKLVQGVIEFEHLGSFTLPHVDDVFCCLGTTIKAAGSQRAFREVDYVYPLRVAQHALEAGATQFLFVSAMGADPGSRVFYSRVKGALEVDAAKLPYRTVIALRPSLLTGARSEFRGGERIAQAVLRPLGFLVPGKFRPISAADVASAMHRLAKRDLAGRHVVDSDEIARLACD